MRKTTIYANKVILDPSRSFTDAHKTHVNTSEEFNFLLLLLEQPSVKT